MDLASTIAAYRAALPGSPAEEFLLRRRIWTDIARDFHLGYVEDPTREHRKYRGMMSIPYLDGNLNPRGLRFRRLDGETPKYLSPRGGGTHLFGVRYTDEAEVCITEGELDALVLYQCGLRAVGIPGSEAWDGEVWRWLFRNCRRVYLLMDNDDAGEVLATRVSRDLRDIVRGDVFRVQPPVGMDVNDWYLSLVKGKGLLPAANALKRAIDESG